MILFVFKIRFFLRNCKSLNAICLKLILSFLYLSFIAYFAHGGEITVSGKYQGQNVYVQNPFTVDKNKYCTEGVYVNSKLILDNPTVSAFEIDLSYLPLNTPVVIKIVFKENCSPQVVNPQVIEVNDAFRFLASWIEAATINWITENEPASSHYFIERLEEQEWVEVAETPAKGEPINNFYKLTVPLTENVNIYRIKLIQPEGIELYSEEIKFLSE